MQRAVIFLISVIAGVPVNAEVRIKQSSSYYALGGVTMDDIDASMHRNAPREGGKIVEGEVDDDLTWRLWSMAEGDTCRIVNDTVTLQINMLLPNWTDRDRSAPAARQAWQEYYAKLLAHEDGHKRIAIKAAYAVDKLFHNVSAVSTCADLEAKLNGAAAAAFENAEEEQERWDENHMPAEMR